MTDSELVLKIDVVSDFICPWCFLGSLRLFHALREIKQKFEGLPIQVKWHPHFLIPKLNAKQVLDKREMYEKRFGSPEKADAMEKQMQAMFKPFGEQYSLNGKVGNTMDAHRLSAWVSKTKGDSAQWELNNGLFRAYHISGESLADRDVLVRVATTVLPDLTQAQVQEFLRSDQYAKEVDENVSKTAETLDLKMFAGGVPHVKADIGSTAFEIPGAQDISYFVRTIEIMINKNISNL